MTKLRIRTKRKETEVFIGSRGFAPLASVLEKKAPSKIILFYDGSVSAVSTRIRSALRKRRLETLALKIRGGESLKTVKSFNAIHSWLAKNKVDRSSIFLAVGGGSVGDAIGFIAATYMRGVPWIGVPTTLLSQVDSSIGGKTGINLAEGKNLVGAFHQPLAVFCDTGALNGLSRRDVTSGLAEALKYGFIYDPDFLFYILARWPRLLSLQKDLVEVIVRKSVKFKARVVEADEFDRKGIREFLNFGHTFGHALERATHYKFYRHGEAVFWGMRFALALSKVRGFLSSKDYSRVAKALKVVQVPPLPSTKPRKIFEFMMSDKKNQRNKLRFILLKNLGRPFTVDDLTSRQLHDALDLMVKS